MFSSDKQLAYQPHQAASPAQSLACELISCCVSLLFSVLVAPHFQTLQLLCSSLFAASGPALLTPQRQIRGFRINQACRLARMRLPGGLGFRTVLWKAEETMMFRMGSSTIILQEEDSPGSPVTAMGAVAAHGRHLPGRR